MSTPTDHIGRATAQRRWWALGLIAAAQFIVIMDTSIIGVALPKMRTDLGFTAGTLSWVFNAYVVAFGGLLLLGGRLSTCWVPDASSQPAGWCCLPDQQSPAPQARCPGNWPAEPRRVSALR